MPDKEHVCRDLRRILKQQPDIGSAKIITDWFAEAPNIFDPNARRKPKAAVVIALSYIALMAAVCAAFNLT